MIERTLFREEHKIFRNTVRKFIEREIVPYHAQWERTASCRASCGSRPAPRGCCAARCRRNTAASALDYLFDVSCSRSCGASGPAVRAS